MEPTRWWPPTDSEATDTGASRNSLHGVRLLEVWASPVGYVGILEARDLSLTASAVIARFLRMISDAAAQVGRAAPVAGVVTRASIAGAGKQLDGELHRLGGDQDWHRGDFFLWPQFLPLPCVDSRAPLDLLVADLIGPLALHQEHAPRLMGVTSRRAVLERLQTMVGRGPAGALVDRLLVSDEGGEDDAIEGWAVWLLGRAQEAAEAESAGVEDVGNDHDDDGETA